MADHIHLAPPPPPPSVDPAQVLIHVGVIRSNDPFLVAEIEATGAFLARIVPLVAAHLARIQPMTTQFNEVFYRRADPDDPSVDPLRDKVEDVIGISALWKLADQLRDAHPEEPPRERED